MARQTPSKPAGPGDWEGRLRNARDFADTSQVNRLTRILRHKDPAAYGARRSTMEEARDLLEQLDRFGAWVEQEMQRR